jgi:hypothetical protein
MGKLKLLPAACLFCLSIAFVCCSSANADSAFEGRVHEGHLCSRNSPWLSVRDFSLRLELKAKDTLDQLSWTLQHQENGDAHLLKLDGVFSAAEGPTEAMLIGGRALLTRNIQIEEHYAIDVLDGPALFQQLALTLIDLASEGGPGNTTFPVHKSITEKKYPIKVTTMSAGASYRAPWKATVDMTKSEKGHVYYKIGFLFATPENKEAEMLLTGQLSNYGEKNSNTPLADDLDIAGWKQYVIGPYAKKTEKGTIYDYGTKYIERPFSSLGQLRNYVAEEERVKKQGTDRTDGR